MPGKANPEPAANWFQAISPFSVLTAWARQGTETFFATQRILLDLVMRQNANTMSAIRERLAQVRAVPLDAMSRMAGEGVSNMIAAERVLLHLAQRENEILVGAVQERAGGNPPGAAVTNTIRRSIDTLVEMQLHFLTMAARQTDLWVESAKAGKPLDGKALPDLARESIEIFVRSQKKFLDVVAEESANWTEGATNDNSGKKAELTQLASQAAEAYIDAQKKVLEVLAQQGEVNFQTLSSIFEVLNPFQPAIVKEFSSNTVENLVTSEKALLEVISKPMRAAVSTESDGLKKPPRKRAAAKRQAAAAGV
jgi:hypothetical protein